MAGTPRSIRIDDDIYTALIQCVAARRSRGEDIDITKLINETLRLQMPIHTWDSIERRVTRIERRLEDLSDQLADKNQLS